MTRIEVTRIKEDKETRIERQKDPDGKRYKDLDVKSKTRIRGGGKETEKRSDPDEWMRGKKRNPEGKVTQMSDLEGKRPG